MTQEKFDKTMFLLKGALDYERFKDVDMVIEILHGVSSQKWPVGVVDGRSLTASSFAAGLTTAAVAWLGCVLMIIYFLLWHGSGLVERGTDPYLIDREITKFEMPMGPFRLADLVGFEVVIATGMQLVENFPERTYRSMIIPIMQEDKRAGEATCKGFYLYDEKGKARPDPELKKYIEKARSVSSAIDPKVKLSNPFSLFLYLGPVKSFAEGIAVKAADLDVAAVMGSKYIYSRLEEWSKLYGGFFKPCAFLAERASKGAPLVGNVIAVLVLLSPAGTFWQIIKHKSTENFESLPYICTLLNASLWTYYGITKPGEYLVATINGFGILVEAIYVTLFLIYAPSKQIRVRTYNINCKTAALVILDVGFLATAILFTRLALQGELRIDALGFICAGINVIMYASPLSAMKTVVTTKSVEYMPFFLSFFLFLNGGIWAFYALLLDDIFLGVPSGAGFVLGTAQLVLYAIYRNAKPSKNVANALEEGTQHEPLISPS
ncbi:hypothetical protein Patl1_25034 [Pistacia atlantica]|uniref:Uncharacterized protein n=1 Tax=Pistacia atlantica TaxID=434234 RepID=A0ACC1B4K1_9ROSI|nr:hypothetical protein Patl1_25034 [Pistacia atlantica]